MEMLLQTIIMRLKKYVKLTSGVSSVISKVNKSKAEVFGYLAGLFLLMRSFCISF